MGDAFGAVGRGRSWARAVRGLLLADLRRRVNLAAGTGDAGRQRLRAAKLIGCGAVAAGLGTLVLLGRTLAVVAPLESVGSADLATGTWVLAALWLLQQLLSSDPALGRALVRPPDEAILRSLPVSRGQLVMARLVLPVAGLGLGLLVVVGAAGVPWLMATARGRELLPVLLVNVGGVVVVAGALRVLLVTLLMVRSVRVGQLPRTALAAAGGALLGVLVAPFVESWGSAPGQAGEHLARVIGDAVTAGRPQLWVRLHDPDGLGTTAVVYAGIAAALAAAATLRIRATAHRDAGTPDRAYVRGRDTGILGAPRAGRGGRDLGALRAGRGGKDLWALRAGRGGRDPGALYGGEPGIPTGAADSRARTTARRDAGAPGRAYVRVRGTGDLGAPRAGRGGRGLGAPRTGRGGRDLGALSPTGLVLRTAWLRLRRGHPATVGGLARLQRWSVLCGAACVAATVTLGHAPWQLPLPALGALLVTAALVTTGEVVQVCGIEADRDCWDVLRRSPHPTGVWPAAKALACAAAVLGVTAPFALGVSLLCGVSGAQWAVAVLAPVAVALAAGCSTVLTWYCVPRAEGFEGGRITRAPGADIVEGLLTALLTLPVTVGLGLCSALAGGTGGAVLGSALLAAVLLLFALSLRSVRGRDLPRKRT
ncbi:hypothetical protein ACIBKX_22880 [Streptomyces sp. NPDC050658]|uniref:hypothetical protein n=1 Tax=unclassified Streptomyces TaxID=2593676 RepID=UPI0034196F0D